jgi:C1A family cysteine protease
LYASCGISTPNTIKRYGIDSAYFLPPVNPNGKTCKSFTDDCSPPAVADIKRAIVEYGAVSLWLKITPSFSAYVRGQPIRNTRAEVAAATVQHGVAIVGWDDTKAAWRFKNSWGTDSIWGSRDGGFGWIAYNDPSLSRMGYAVVTPQDKPWTLSEQQVAMIRWVARLALKPVIWIENPRVNWPVSLGFPREPITVVDGIRNAINRALIPPSALDQLPGFPRG